MNNIKRVVRQRNDLATALREVMEWINNWDADFKYDPEWPATETKVSAALAELEDDDVCLAGNPAKAGVCGDKDCVCAR